MNTNALQGIRCPRCGNADKFQVEALVNAVVVDNGVDEYKDPEWEADAGTTCTECGFRDAWQMFQVEGQKPVSRCAQCAQVIIWDGEHWSDLRTEVASDDGDRLICLNPSTSPTHVPLWLTLGELRDRTKHLPDNMPITIGTPADLQGLNEWLNVHLGDVPAEWPADDEQPSLILEATDDFDTRQW